jgi:pyridoxine kinase
MEKAAVINDFSGFGRCSLAVALPVLSVCGIQCCSVPTAVFTNHTGYPSFEKNDLTDFLPRFISEWQKLRLSFDTIAAGYLSSPEQIEFTIDFITTFKKGAIVVIDPVMGDNGRLYNSFSPETAKRMKKLAAAADILTPNLTEACILTDTPYNDSPGDAEISSILGKLSKFGARDIVITGIEQGGFIRNIFTSNGVSGEYTTEKKAPTRSGTGDLFSAVVTAGAVKKLPFETSVRVAADFVKAAAELSAAEEIPITDGAAFEPILHTLPGKLFR